MPGRLRPGSRLGGTNEQPRYTSTYPSRGFVGIVLLIAIALVAAMASVAGAVPQPGPAVPSAGVGTAAAKDSPNCGPDAKLAYPYQQRAPCTRPLKKGESNGGATSMGVTKDTIKIVLFLGTKDQQQQTWTSLGRHHRRIVQPVRTATRGCVRATGTRCSRTATTRGDASSSTRWSRPPAPTKRRNAPTRSTSPRRSRSRWSSPYRASAATRSARARCSPPISSPRRSSSSSAASPTPKPRSRRRTAGSAASDSNAGRGQRRAVRGAPAQGRDRQVVG